jgi:hypothetical protein
METASKAPQVFCGVVYDKVLRGEGVEVTLEGSGHRIRIASSKDKGLAFLPKGKRRHFVVEDGKILAVYIRPRIRLLKLAGAGMPIEDSLLLALKPVYPFGIGRLSKKIAKRYNRSPRLRMYLLEQECRKHNGLDDEIPGLSLL